MRAYVGVGSNLGSPATHVREALTRLAGLPGVSGMRASSLYDADAVADYEQPPYVNAVAEVETDLGPQELLRALEGIQRGMGQVVHPAGAPRIIDLDLLLCGDVVVDEPECTVPHPRMHKRAFVLVPLCELAPEVAHPVKRRTARALLDALTEPSRVRPRPEGD